MSIHTKTLESMKEWVDRMGGDSKRLIDDGVIGGGCGDRNGKEYYKLSREMLSRRGISDDYHVILLAKTLSTLDWFRDSEDKIKASRRELSWVNVSLSEDELRELQHTKGQLKLYLEGLDPFYREIIFEEERDHYYVLAWKWTDALFRTPIAI